MEATSYRVDVLAIGETRWANNALRFDTTTTARAYALDLFGRWMAVDKMRVVSVETPERETYVPGTEDQF
jgi:hypothetical protein